MSNSKIHKVDLYCEIFQPSENFKAYREFIDLRFEIFGREQGWKSLTHPESLPETAPEGFDRRGRYLLLRKRGVGAIGIGRGLALHPNRVSAWGFEAHLQFEAFCSCINHLATLTDVAVHRDYRKTLYREGAKCMTMGQAIVYQLFKHYLKDAKIVLGSADTRGSYKFLKSLGAYLISLRKEVAEPESRPLIDFAILLDDQQRLIRTGSPLRWLSNGSSSCGTQLRDYFHALEEKCIRQLNFLQ